MKKKDEKLLKKPRQLRSYRLPLELISKIRRAHTLEVRGQTVQVSENTFVIHLLEKALRGNVV